MSIEIGILLAVISAAVCVATFFCGKLSAIKSSAKSEENRLTRIETKIDHLGISVDEVKTDIKDSVRNLHRRIDDHLRYDHGINVQPRDS